MELHHDKHHQTYVTSYNAAAEQLATAEHKQDIAAIIALQPVINFHGGGHINHSLFWENLAPSKNGGGGEPSGKLKVRLFSWFYSDISRSVGWLEEWLMNCTNRRQSKPAMATSLPSKPNSTPH
jgi:Fe-Mn family superoxide dismutase